MIRSVYPLPYNVDSPYLVHTLIRVGYVSNSHVSPDLDNGPYMLTRCVEGGHLFLWPLNY